MRGSKLVALLALMTVLLSVEADAAPELAADASSADPVALDLVVDIPLMVSAGVLGGVLYSIREQIVTDRCAPLCDDGHISALDRSALGLYNVNARTAGDVVLVANLVVPLAFDFAYQRSIGAPARHFITDAVIVGEALAVSVGVQQLVSFATQRPRPYAYSPQLSPGLAQNPDTYLSFYSGHTATSFAAATATSYLFSLRYPSSRWRIPLWTLTHGLAAFDGYLRVAAGYHFWTDVLMGAIAGSSIGLIVPAIHRRNSPTRQAWLAPMPVPGGAVVSLLVHQ